MNIYGHFISISLVFFNSNLGHFLVCSESIFYHNNETFLQVLFHFFKYFWVISTQLLGFIWIFLGLEQLLWSCVNHRYICWTYMEVAESWMFWRWAFWTRSCQETFGFFSRIGFNRSSKILQACIVACKESKLFKF